MWGTAFDVFKAQFKYFRDIWDWNPEKLLEPRKSPFGGRTPNWKSYLFYLLKRLPQNDLEGTEMTQRNHWFICVFRTQLLRYRRSCIYSHTKYAILNQMQTPSMQGNYRLSCPWWLEPSTLAVWEEAWRIASGFDAGVCRIFISSVYKVKLEVEV